MKITILDCSEGEEEEIIIKCRNMDEQLLRTIYALKAGREKITVSKEDKLMQIQPRDIYYFEAKLKLYELEDNFQNTDFFRASKSTIINLVHVKNLSPSLGGRYEVCMKNGEKLMISRQYVPDLKRKLGLKG